MTALTIEAIRRLPKTDLHVHLDGSLRLDTILELAREDGIERLVLNRPEVRNAFNDALIDELAHWAARTAADADLRAVVVSGAGPTFCAGADLAWMANAVTYTDDENRAISKDLGLLKR